MWLRMESKTGPTKQPSIFTVPVLSSDRFLALSPVPMLRSSNRIPISSRDSWHARLAYLASCAKGGHHLLPKPNQSMELVEIETDDS